MKDFLLFLALGIVIFITESILLAMPRFQWFRYDLFIPLIIFMGLYQPTHVGLPLCILFGFFMDVFSGGIFGLFLSIYFWLFCLVKAVLRFLDLQNLFLEAVLVIFGVAAENLTIIILMQLLGQGELRYVTLQDIIVQTLFAGATTPFIFVVFFRLRNMQLPKLFYLR